MNRQSVDFTKAFNSLDSWSPLRGDQLPLYYVDRPGNPFPEMLLSIKTTNSNTKILFSGSRGSGKTTEMIRLYSALEDQFFVVLFDSIHSIDVSEADIVQLLFALILQVYKSANERRVRLKHVIIEDIYDLITIASVAEEKKRDGQVDVSAELNAQIAKLTSTLSRLN